MANLIPDINNPTINSKTDDHSTVDQSHNINVAGDYVASNSNNSGMTKKQNQPHPWWTATICGVMILGLGWFLDSRITENKITEKDDFQEISHRLDTMSAHSKDVHESLVKSIEQSKEQIEVAKEQAKEGTIWLLRDDIIKSIDFFETTKMISSKQYKRLKDEYDYYISIGGNHDVKERYDDFCTKLLVTRVIKILDQQIPAGENYPKR